MTTFKDIIKNKVLEQFGTGGISLTDALIAIIVSVLIGIVIYLVYKHTFKGVVYSSNFNFSLILMTVITAVIIITIQSNLVLSLGMVGALSIVRFRAAVKDPVDIMYLFWAISMGIITGAGQFAFGFIVCAIIAALCFIMYFFKDKTTVYLMIVKYSPNAAEGVNQKVKETGAKLRNKTASNEKIEITIELTKKQLSDDLVESFMKIDGVKGAVLVNYNGEYCE